MMSLSFRYLQMPCNFPDSTIINVAT
jgi:hypothetical protein